MKRGGGGILPPQNKTIIFIYLPRLCPAFSSHLTSILTAYSLPPGSAFLPKALLYYKNLVKTICTQQMQEQQLAVHTHGGKMRWESLSLGRTMRGEWSVHRCDSGVVLMSKVERTSSVQQIRCYRGKDRTGNPTLERTFEISQIPSPQDFSQNQITAGDFPRTFWLSSEMCQQWTRVHAKRRENWMAGSVLVLPVALERWKLGRCLWKNTNLLIPIWKK